MSLSELRQTRPTWGALAGKSFWRWDLLGMSGGVGDRTWRGKGRSAMVSKTPPQPHRRLARTLTHQGGRESERTGLVGCASLHPPYKTGNPPTQPSSTRGRETERTGLVGCASLHPPYNEDPPPQGEGDGENRIGGLRLLHPPYRTGNPPTQPSSTRGRETERTGLVGCASLHPPYKTRNPPTPTLLHKGEGDGENRIGGLRFAAPTLQDGDPTHPPPQGGGRRREQDWWVACCTHPTRTCRMDRLGGGRYRSWRARDFPSHWRWGFGSGR